MWPADFIKHCPIQPADQVFLTSSAFFGPERACVPKASERADQVLIIPHPRSKSGFIIVKGKPA
ncbi:hypothetical protein [Roseovarius sp.]|uniref:hypothetical protein n=1 Tax=Roseovarius sp. TaxID=1486281 RepID=UPI003565BAA6